MKSDSAIEVSAVPMRAAASSAESARVARQSSKDIASPNLWSIEPGSRLAQLLVEEEIATSDLEGLEVAGTEGLLGTGGFGEVRKVTWRGTPVAAKIAHKTDDDQTKKALFLRELEVMVSCRHPNVVQFLGYVDFPFMIVMEYLPLGDLKMYWAQHRGMTKGHKTGVCIDVLRALAYLHNRKPSSIIHRDIKPTNVLITKSGVAKLTDFGLSRVLGSSSPTMSPAPSNPNSRAPSKHGGSAFANMARIFSPGPSRHGPSDVFSRVFSPGPSKHSGDAFCFEPQPPSPAPARTSGNRPGSPTKADRTVADGTAFSSFADSSSPPSLAISGSLGMGLDRLNEVSSTMSEDVRGITLLKVAVSELDTSPQHPRRRSLSPSGPTRLQYAKDATAVVGTAQYMA